MRIVILIGVSLLICTSANAQKNRSVGDLISGNVTSVADGASFRVGYERIRLWGIDAPERRARCSTGSTIWTPVFDSTVALRECLRGTTVTCRIQKIERRTFAPRYVAECWRDSDKEDVAACMVRSGWATDWPGLSGGHYAPLEEEPKAVRRGLWQCDGEPPTRRWCGRGARAPCEQPIYKPRGPGQG